MDRPRPPAPRRPDLLLLDAGNTLVFLDHGEIARTLQGLGLDVDAARLAAAEAEAMRRYEAEVGAGKVGHEQGWMIFAGVMLERAGIPPDMAPMLVQRVRQHHDRKNLWRRVPDALPPALERLLDAGVRLAVLSNAEGTVERLLEEVGLRPYLERVFDSHHMGLSKPDPRIFQRAVEALEVPPERAMYAGDIPGVDVEGARSAGLDAVLIDARGLYPDYDGAPVFDSVAALADALLA